MKHFIAARKIGVLELHRGGALGRVGFIAKNCDCRWALHAIDLHATEIGAAKLWANDQLVVFDGDLE